MRELQRGDLVRVRRDEGDEWCRALVHVASRTSVLLTLADDAPVRQGEGFVMGALPLTIDYERGIAQGLMGDFYEIGVAETSQARSAAAE
jgi:hypothetical protein